MIRGRLFHLRTLVIGTAGGAAFMFAGLPLPWMLGALSANALAAVAGLHVIVSMRLRAVMVVVLGTLLGSAFSPAILPLLRQWPVSLAAMLGYVLLGGGAAFLIYRRGFGLDRITAFYAGMPGGLTEMTIAGEAAGGNVRVITLAHTMRVFLVVMAIPFWFRATGAYQGGSVTPGAGLFDVPFSELAILVLTAIAGVMLGRVARLPAPMLIGPMLTSSLAHLFALSNVPPPPDLVVVAQIIMGSALGCRFSGISRADLARAALAALPATIAILAVSALFAWALERTTGLSIVPLFLAFAPGGLTEMGLIALALGNDVAFVASHHIARIFMVILVAPILWRLLYGWLTAGAGRADKL